MTSISLRPLRNILKLSNIPFSFSTNIRRSKLVVLSYHMVSGKYDSDFDIHPDVFTKQMEILASTGRVVALEDILSSSDSLLRTDGPVIAITFDDAYIDFYTTVYPTIERLSLPVTLFAPVGFVSDPSRYPVSPTDTAHRLPQPCTWSMLREMSDRARVTVASHGYSHHPLPLLSARQQEWEFEASKEVLEKNLDRPVYSFAWPKGYWNAESEDRAAKHYQIIARFAGGSVSSATPDRIRVPRTPVRRSDGELGFFLKYSGVGSHKESFRAIVDNIKNRRHGMRR